MQEEIKLVYQGELDTQKEIETLFCNLTQQESLEIAERIGLAMYGFEVLYRSSQWMVYRTHNEIIVFMKKFAHKFKTAITFENMKNDTFLEKIVMGNPEIRQENWFKDFIEIDLSENNSVYQGKKKSQLLKKHAGGRYYQLDCCKCWKWKNCEAIIVVDGIVTANPSTKKVQEFMHFGKDFRWTILNTFDEHTIVIHSYHRKMTFTAKNQKDFFLFAYFLEINLSAYKNQQKSYRFNSFSPLRFHNEVNFYIDGADYFESLAHSIEKAKEEVFICGWWVSPEFHLIRPCEGKNLDYRLDNLLARTAKKGIKIYIILYFESSFLSNDSEYTINTLQSLHEKNIKVIRHPQIVLPTFWSHHEKLVVIDQELAFMGGLDICYGRYDSQNHLIEDNSQLLYPGIEYNNCRINDFADVKNYRKQNVERDQSRLPWHDVALKIRGRSVKDLTRHFIQYWNYASYQSHYANRFVLVTKNKQQRAKPKKLKFLESIKDFASDLKDKIKGKNDEQKNKDHENNGKNSPVVSKEQFKGCEQFSDKAHEKKVQNENTEIMRIFTPVKKKEVNKVQLNGMEFSLEPKKSLPQKLLQVLSPSKKKTIEVSMEGNKASQMSKVSQMRKMETGDRIYESQMEEDGEKSEAIEQFDIGLMLRESESEEEDMVKDGRRGEKHLEARSENVGETEYEEKEEEENINERQKIIHDSLVTILNWEKKIDENDNFIQDDLKSDFLNEKSHKPARHKGQTPLNHNTHNTHNRNLSEYSPDQHQEEDRMTGINSWMKKLIKKTKQTFARSDESDFDHHQRVVEESEYQEICQVVRSVSQWSIGCMENNTEKSIQEAYISLIEGAEKYIYIENQFFISAMKKNGVVKNHIMDALCQRIIKAIQKEESFKAIVFMPLIPGFAGELDEPNATLPRVIMNWQYKTICRSPGSLLQRLRKYTENPERYISFYSLRNHGVVGNIPKTEIIYLHSKLMIVDDRKLICGSANINDRSMEGNRDSELCLVVEADGNKEIKIDQNREKFFVVEKIHNLRKSLMSEHFSLPARECVDMIGSNNQKRFYKIAQGNTAIYRELFGCYPDDQIAKLSQIKQFKSTPSLQQYLKCSERIQGHAVEFPLHFLEQEKMTSMHPNALST